MLRSRDHNAAWLDDPRLLGSYLGQCVAQDLSMVQAYRSDGAHPGPDNVSRIEAAAKAGLQHLKVRLLVLEMGEGQGGQDFKSSQLTMTAESVERVELGLEPLNQGGKLVL